MGEGIIVGHIGDWGVGVEFCVSGSKVGFTRRL